MILIVIGIVILIISVILSFRSLGELDTPWEVKRLMRKKKVRRSGVILFLKKKIIHYSNN